MQRIINSNRINAVLYSNRVVDPISGNVLALRAFQMRARTQTEVEEAQVRIDDARKKREAAAEAKKLKGTGELLQACKGGKENEPGKSC